MNKKGDNGDTIYDSSTTVLISKVVLSLQMTFFLANNILHECGTDGEAGQWLMKALLLNVAEAFVPIIAASKTVSRREQMDSR